MSQATENAALILGLPKNATKAEITAEAKKRAAQSNNPTVLPFLGVPGGVVVDKNTGQAQVGPDGGLVYGPYTQSRLQPYTNPALSGYLDSSNISQYQTPVQYPKYLQGAEISEVTNLMPDQISALQHRMQASGLYYNATDPIQYGVMNGPDYAAFQKLLEDSNANYQTWDQHLTQVESNPPPAAAKRTPLVVSLTDPRDIKQITNQVATDLYGGNLPDEDLQRITQQLHDAETQYQQQKYNLSDPNAPGGTTIAAPNIQSVAEDEIRKAHPEQVAATQLGSQMDSMIQTLMSGPFSAK